MAVKFEKVGTIFVLDKLNILNKELENTNLMPKALIEVLARCAQNILEIVTKQNHIFKHFHSITKQMLR